MMIKTTIFIRKSIGLLFLIGVIILGQNKELLAGGSVSCDAPDGCPTNSGCFSPPCPPPPPPPPPPPCPCDAIKSILTGCDATCVPGNPFCEFIFSGNETCNNGGNQGGSIASGSNTIERTFLKKKPTQIQSKNIFDECIFPDIEISIEKNEMLSLMEIGSKRIRLTLDTSITMMNVGMASEDTQFWFMPEIDYNTIGVMESVLPSSSPFISDFPGSNRVYRSQIFGGTKAIYSHFNVNDDDVTLNGDGYQNPTDTFFYHSFETVADFPIQCGTTVEAKTETQFGFSTDVDSIIETKDLVVRATGMLTPIREKPVRALLSYHDYTSKVYLNGEVTDSLSYSVFTWFSEAGHRITGILKPGAPTEGLTEFISIEYERSIPACPDKQDLGSVLNAGAYKAQTELTCAANIVSGPVQFSAAQSINLNPGFSTISETNLLIDPDPCSL